MEACSIVLVDTVLYIAVYMYSNRGFFKSMKSFLVGEAGWSWILGWCEPPKQ